jgi:cell division protein FtsQ
MLPAGEEPDALHRLAQLQRSQHLLVRPLEAIDMRLPDRLVVRQRPVPAADPAATDGASGDAQSGRKTNDGGIKPDGVPAPTTAGRTESGAASTEPGRRPA